MGIVFTRLAGTSATIPPSMGSNLSHQRHVIDAQVVEPR